MNPSLQFDGLADLTAKLAQAVPDPGKRVVDDIRVTDHHALLPTDRTADSVG